MAIAALLLGLGISAAPAAAGWKTVFEDDFNGTSLDLSKWYTRYIYNNGTLDTLKGELQVFRDDGHIVESDGTLKLIATKTNTGNPQKPYQSGMIRSRQTFRYGYFEARVKLPKGRGLHSTFWLCPDFDAQGRALWPPEIDIMEFVNNGTTEPPHVLHASTHSDRLTRSQAGPWIYSDPEFKRKGGRYRAPVDLTDDWHTYSLLWEPDKVTVYFDGKKLFTKGYKWVNRQGEPAGPADIIFNLAVGGAWVGNKNVDDSAFPAELQVDYVRVCQQSDDPSAPKLCGDSKFTPSE